MSQQISDQEKQHFSVRFTLKGRIFHSNLLKPFVSDEDASKGKQPRYNTMFAFRAEENKEVFTQIMKFLELSYNTFHPNIPLQHWINPMKHYDTYVSKKGQKAKDYLQGHHWVNASSGLTVPPVVCRQGPNGTFINLTVNDEAEVYSGRNAAIQISFYRISNQNNGIGTNVNAVLILDGGDKVQSGEVDVNQVFGAFAADMAPAGGGGFNPFASSTPASAPAAAPAVNGHASAQPANPFGPGAFGGGNNTATTTTQPGPANPFGTKFL